MPAWSSTHLAHNGVLSIEGKHVRLDDHNPITTRDLGEPQPTACRPSTEGSPAHASKRRSTYIPALDGVRGLAILLVLMFHFTVVDSSAKSFRGLALHLTNAGWVGVDLFFVLSGFLITSILYEAKNTDGFFRNFYMRRVLRIFPLYYGALFVAFVVVAQFTPVVVSHEWALWLYLTNYFAPRGAGFIHFWSLAVEEQYYLVWPAVVFLLGRRALMRVCGVMIVAALGFRIWRTMHGLQMDHQHAAIFADYTYYATYCRMDALAAGALIALASHGPAGIGALAKPAKILGFLAAAGLAAIFVKNYGFFGYADPAVQTIGYSLLAALFGAFLIAAVLAPAGSVIERVFTNRALRFFGKYSYGIYVIHGIIGPSLERHWPMAQMPHAAPLFFASVFGRIGLGTGISVLAALVSWHLYEKHFLKLKRFFEYRAPTLAEPVRDAIIPPPAHRPEQVRQIV